MTGPLLGAYRPGTSPLHRLPPGPKLAVLAAWSILVVALPWPLTLLLPAQSSTLAAADLTCTGVALIIGFSLLLISGLTVWEAVRVGRGMLFIAVPLFLFQWWQQGPTRAASIVGTLFALLFAATAVSASCAPSDLVDGISRWLRPFRRLGVKPERVALTFSLAIAALPTVLKLSADTADAARARGLDRSLRARLVPFILRTVAYAQLLGDALMARGVDDESEA